MTGSFVEHIKRRLNLDDISGRLIVGGKKIEISSSDFLPLAPSSPEKISYIDGGEGILLESSELIGSIIRTAHIDYNNGKRRNISRRDILFLGTLSEEKKIVCRLFDKDLNSLPYREFILDIDDDLFKESSRIKLNKVSSLIRRLEELRLADELSRDSFVVLDGSLEEEHPSEREYLKNKNIAGLVKNFHLITERGRDGKRILINKSKECGSISWAYDLGDRKVLKLSPKSSFLTLFYGDNPSRLLFESDDALFRGYPYGLIIADRLARVSNREVEIMKNKLSCMLKEEYKHIALLEDNHAHKILDSIS